MGMKSHLPTAYWLFSIISIICLQFYSVMAQSKALRSRQIGTEGQIIARMFSEYDANARPPVRGCYTSSPLVSSSHNFSSSLSFNSSRLVNNLGFILCISDEADHSAIAVIVSLYINKIQWQTNTAEIELYLRQQWEDSRLAYDVDVREAINDVVVPPNRRLWVPDTYFMNADERTNDLHRERNVVEPSGYVRSSEKRSISVSVENDERFPFVNTRSIKLKLSSYKYQVDDVVYLWANSPPVIVPVEVSKELLEGPYAFSEAFAGDCVGNYTIGVYSCIDVSISFEGSSSESFLRIFLPSILLLIVSWLHFWIHGSWSVPRTISAALPFFIFFVLLVFYPNISWSNCGPLQVWLVFCLILSFLSLLEYFVVICCGVRRRVAYRNGHPTHITTGDPNAPLTVQAGKETIDVEYETSRCAGFKNNNGIDVVSRIAFPLIFLVFFIIFLIFYVI